ncbi:MAG: hypothetical protein ACKVVT_06535 [Dehalococcoidia bacterium]
MGAVVVSIAGLGWLGRVMSGGPAHAQGPACQGFLEFADQPAVKGQVVPGLALNVRQIDDEKGLADPGQKIDEVRATWSDPGSGVAGGKAKCIWVAMKEPGDENDFPGFAQYILAPSEREFVFVPEAIEGELCFRFVLISDTARGEPTDRCVTIKQSRPHLIASDNNPAGPPPAAPSTGTGAEDGTSWILPGSLLAGFVALLGLLLAAYLVRGRREQSHGR